MTTTSNTWNAELLSKFKATPTPVLDAVSQALVDEIHEIQDAIVALLAKRRLTNATGIWLDNIGGIAGYPRPVELVADDNIFTYSSLNFYAYVGNSTDGITTTTFMFRVAEGATIRVRCLGYLDENILGFGEFVTLAINHGANGPVRVDVSGDSGSITGLRIYGSVVCDLKNIADRLTGLTELTISGEGAP